QGGDLGFIPRHDVMEEAFSQAAFSLANGEISRPIVTSFGVHLIRVTDQKPGNKDWHDARQELREPASRALLDTLVAQERSKAKIAFTGLVPHFKPGTKELATPEKRGSDKVTR